MLIIPVPSFAALSGLPYHNICHFPCPSNFVHRPSNVKVSIRQGIAVDERESKWPTCMYSSSCHKDVISLQELHSTYLAWTS